MGITQPIKFEDLDSLNNFYYNLLTRIQNIYQKYNVPEYFETVNINKDDENYELYILKMGAYGKGMDDEKAHEEILSTFEKMFNS